MNQFIAKITAGFCVLMLLFTTLFSMPVYADDVILDDYLDEFWWKVIERNVNMMMMLYYEDENGNNPYRFQVYEPTSETVDTSNTKGWDVLTTSRDYYTSSEGQMPISGYGHTGTAYAYQSGNTFNAPLVQNTYNSTTNNYDYTFNMPTYNNYETYNISNIYYVSVH